MLPFRDQEASYPNGEVSDLCAGVCHAKLAL